MKLQWNSMTDFARNVLRKMGAVPESEYQKVVKYNDMLNAELRILAKNAAKELPFMIEPKVLVSQDSYYQGRKITLVSRNLHHIISDHELHNLASTEVYRKHLITQLSKDWASQTEKVVDEMIREI
jgi:hypothetical protein